MTKLLSVQGPQTNRKTLTALCDQERAGALQRQTIIYTAQYKTAAHKVRQLFTYFVVGSTVLFRLTSGVSPVIYQ